jgi:hypothetical protein
MKSKGWMVSVLVAGGLVYGIKARSGCLNNAAPDQRLAQHFAEMCDIARDHTKSPEKGVKKLGRYLVVNLGSITGSFGSTIATIERVKDDEAHDERAVMARDRLHAVACHDEWQKFFDAVEADPEATALVNQGVERLSRTLEILLGPVQGGTRFTLRDLPLRLERALAP